MNWDSVVGSLVAEVFLPLVLTLAIALGGWLVSRLPGPLRDWLASATHKRDVELISSALMRRALAISSGEVRPASPPLDLAQYVRATLPEVLAKVAPSEEALRTMALAALQSATSKPGPPPPA